MLGESLALASALTWALSVILFKSSEAASPTAINLFKNTAALSLLTITMLVTGTEFAQDRPWADWGALALSGILGIAIADNLYLSALRRLGAGLLAVVECAYAPVIVLFSVVFLAEEVGWAFAIGATLVVAGIYFASSSGKSVVVLVKHLDPRQRRIGILSALLGIVLMGFGVVLAKPILNDAAVLEVTCVRLLAGWGAQLGWVLLNPRARPALGIILPSKVWRTLAPAAFLGSYLSMMLWLGGFKWTSVSTASVLNQMTVVFTLILARVFLGETLSHRRTVGAALALTGALVVLVS
ncbi:MAG: DMT family transporter [Myxococcales bacterium]|nr:DMT family transporter [Myxococcales bacterium]